jgi:hypothetical protein
MEVFIFLLLTLGFPAGLLLMSLVADDSPLLNAVAVYKTKNYLL